MNIWNYKNNSNGNQRNKHITNMIKFYLKDSIWIQVHVVKLSLSPFITFKTSI